MTTAVLHPPASTARPGREPHPTFGGILRAEIIKLLSLRSTLWISVLTVIFMALVAVAQSAATDYILQGGARPHGAEFVTGGYQLAMVTIAVLGALSVTGEFSTGTIGSTFAVTPWRLTVLSAKALAVSMVVIAVTAASILVSFVATAPLLSDHDLVPQLGDRDTWQVFGGVVFFYVTAALTALAIGAIVRHTAGAISLILALLLVLPGVLQFVPVQWVYDTVSVLPLPAAVTFLSVSGVFGDNTMLHTWQAVLVLLGYVAVTGGIAAVTWRRRDV